MPKETLKQRDKRKLDLQLDEELDGTFPASDPLKITRYSSETPAPTRPPRTTKTALGD
jgi:hypothetical protein